MALLLLCLASVAIGERPSEASATGVPAATQRFEPPLPQAREESAAAAVGNRLYVLGGFDAAGNDSSTVFVFDGRHWHTGPPLPLALDHLAAAVLDGRLYVAGGFSAGIASDQVFRLAASGRSWSEIARLHHARGAEALVASGHALYVLGGKDSAGVEIPAGESYSVTARRWSDTPALPLPRDHVSGFTYRGWACIAGGRSPNTSRVDCYDPARRDSAKPASQWRRLPDLPAPTSGAGATTFRGSVVVGGGEVATEGGTVIPQLARLVRGHWRVSRMLLPRHGLEFAVYRGRIWACGGGIEPGLHPTAACTSLA